MVKLSERINDTNAAPFVIEEIRNLEDQLEELRACAQESQDWNWLSAKDYAADHGFYDIKDMQRLHEIAFNKTEENE